MDNFRGMNIHPTLIPSQVRDGVAVQPGTNAVIVGEAKNFQETSLEFAQRPGVEVIGLDLAKEFRRPHPAVRWRSTREAAPAVDWDHGTAGDEPP